MNMARHTAPNPNQANLQGPYCTHCEWAPRSGTTEEELGTCGCLRREGQSPEVIGLVPWEAAEVDMVL